jgi:triosephosphate isomerase
MARRKLLFGNWKMNNTLAQTKEFCSEAVAITKLAEDKGISIGVAPSYLSLAYAAEHKAGLKVFAEEVHYLDHGAFTGNVSIPMIKEVGAEGSLVGHSERRAYEKETDFDCNLRIKALVKANLAAIYCVGETLKEFEANQAEDVIRAQILVGLMGLKAEDMKNIIIAYEPVWSIGTGKNASEEIAENICKYIRGIIASMFGKKVAEETIILYGGSVKPNNIHGYLAQEDVDGALVGGASLTSESFKELIQNV